MLREPQLEEPLATFSLSSIFADQLFFADNDINGEALIALRHDDLKEMNIMSIGHRLTILKGVYDIKLTQGIPIDSDHWIPPCK